LQILPSYTHIVNPKLKHTYLTFDSEGNLVIKSPHNNQKEIERLLISKSAWIERSRKKISEKKGNLSHLSKLKNLFYKGSEYPLFLEQYGKKRIKLLFSEEVFTLFYAEYDEKKLLKKIDTFYKSESQEYLPYIVEAWADKMKLYPKSLSFRKTKRQWGSCSGRNDICFNTMMMKLPVSVIEYIVVHELAHIKHKHHQKSFWALVEHFLPHYREARKELKSYTT